MSSGKTKRGNSLKMYHLNLLKPWREVVPVVPAIVVAEKEKLGLEVKAVAQVTPINSPIVSESTGCEGILLHYPFAETS